MLATLQARLIAGGVVAVVILFTIWRVHANAYQAGSEDKDQEWRDVLELEAEQAAANKKEDEAHSENVATEESEKEIQIVEKIRVVEREVPKIIEKIITVKPGCAVLPELGILFSQQAEASNSQ